MKNIIFVSHCILNTASMVELYNKEDIEAEEKLRLKFLSKAIEKGIQIIQLPCPEFLMYGSSRWGHVSNQFDNPFFKDNCRKILKPILDQFDEYYNHSEKFNILGIVGIDGSPSCGVDYTSYSEKWFGSFLGRDDLEDSINDVSLYEGNGIFINVLVEELFYRGYHDEIKIVGLFANEENKCLDILDEII